MAVRVPWPVFGNFFLLGVIATDLVFDIGAPDDATRAAYYRGHRETQGVLPKLFVPAGILLSAVPVLYSAATRRNFVDVVCALVLPVLLYVFVAVLIPAQEAIVDQFSADRLNAANPAEAARLFALNQKVHSALALVMLVVAALQLSSHRITAPKPKQK
eukprot:m.489082 g.489082  ORF g.489082 m.489082 type:complete len:159 (+) comp26368_c0_seq1:180-656(+)